MSKADGGGVIRPLSPRFGTHQAAVKAIEFLIQQESFYPGTKRQFAFAMNWYQPDGKSADVRRVQDVCKHTRDQENLPGWMQDELAGMVIAYAPIKGGMTLIDPSDGSNLDLHHYVHLLAGDLTRQQQHRTENRGRLAMWSALTTAAFSAGYQRLAKLSAQAEDQIKQNGEVSESTTEEFMKELALLGFFGEAA